MPLPIIAAAAIPGFVSIFLKFFIGSLIFRVVTALGIAIVSFAAIDIAANFIEGYISQATGNVTGQVRDVAQLLGFFDMINIIVSAYLASIAIRQIRGLYNKLTFGRTV